MSADATIVYYGIRLEPDQNELDLMEKKLHPVRAQARKADLDFTCDNFDEPDERYYLFIGKDIGYFGLEGISEKSLDIESLKRISEEVDRKLKDLGYSEKPALWIQYRPDA